MLIGSGAIVVELEDFGGSLMASLLEQWLKMLECENTIAERSGSARTQLLVALHLSIMVDLTVAPELKSLEEGAVVNEEGRINLTLRVMALEL